MSGVGTRKNMNFEGKNDTLVCHSCHTESMIVPCPAVKICEVSEDKKEVTVYHHGNHTCVAMDKRISKEIADDASIAFQHSRQLKPQRYVNDKIIATIEKATCSDEIHEVEVLWLTTLQFQI